MTTLEPGVPVSARSTIAVGAPPQQVWAILADIEGWSSWNPAVRSAVLHGSLDAGTAFHLAAGPGTIRARLKVVDEPRSLSWSGSWLTLRSSHSWRIEATESGCVVWSEATVRGLLARVFRIRLRRSMAADQDAWVHLLKLEAEERAAEARAAEERAADEATDMADSQGGRIDRG